MYIYTVTPCSCIPAVNHSGRSVTVRVYVFSHQVSETDQGLGALRHAVVRPRSEVEVPHCALLVHLALS